MSREENGMIFLIGKSKLAGDGGLAVHLHDNVYIDTGHYCDRNICTKNEYNGVSCDECEVAKYHNLEDDDSPCQNCGVGE